jgi:hypothetical protein
LALLLLCVFKTQLRLILPRDLNRLVDLGRRPFEAVQLAPRLHGRGVYALQHSGGWISCYEGWRRGEYFSRPLSSLCVLVCPPTGRFYIPVQLSAQLPREILAQGKQCASVRRVAPCV